MSFEFEIDEGDRCRAELIGLIGKDLQKLFVHRKQADGATQQSVADAMGVDRSRVNKCLTGHANLTISTIADMSRAMKGKAIIKIVPEEDFCNWKLVWSNPKPTATGGQNTSLPPTSQATHPQAAVGNWK